MRVLAIRPGGIGDCILAFPAMQALRGHYLEVWCRPDVVPLVQFADRARGIASTGLDLLGLADVAPPPGLVEALRGFDSIVSWYGANRPDLRQAALDLGLPARFLDALPRADGTKHASDFFLGQVGAAAGGIPRIDCEAPRGNFAVIHPFSGGAAKNWPLERFRQVARHLERILPVEWCAGPEEPLPGALRFDDLRELAVYLASARVYLGNDSGITHLAAAVGTPVVALFGPTDPRVWGPRGQAVEVVATPRPGEPVTGIEVEEVIARVVSLC